LHNRESCNKACIGLHANYGQSSFSWMLEPEPHLDSSKSSPPKPAAPFLKVGRKPTSGPNREKAAFLFGDEGGESSFSNARMPLLRDDEEGFDLGTIAVSDKSK
jgi:TBC1 domain family protein 5